MNEQPQANTTAYGWPESPVPPAREPQRATPSIGTLLLGGIIVLVGLLWLLDIAGAVDSPWGAVLPGTLIVIGVALILDARSGSHPGLITAGALITVVLAVSSMVHIPVSGEVGDRTFQPATLADVRERYDLAIGTQTLDLRSVEFPAGVTRIDARTGIGELVVRVPQGVAVEATWRVGIGDARVLNHERSGFGLRDEDRTAGYGTADRRVELVVSVGIGSLVVEHGR
jgi:hypothetical protein